MVCCGPGMFNPRSVCFHPGSGSATLKLFRILKYFLLEPFGNVIRDVYRGSRIPDFFHPGSRGKNTLDPGTATPSKWSVVASIGGRWWYVCVQGGVLPNIQAVLLPKKSEKGEWAIGRTRRKICLDDEYVCPLIFLAVLRWQHFFKIETENTF